MTKGEMFLKGKELLNSFCDLNSIHIPRIIELTPEDPYYHLRTCGFYRFKSHEYSTPAIWIMIPKCAHIGTSAQAWSYPGYVIDRTPYGVLAHELGHHIDAIKSARHLTDRNYKEESYSYCVWELSQEQPITNYLGTDNETITFYMEWFAENFRLFLTNPDLCRLLRPKFYSILIADGVIPAEKRKWREVLEHAPERTFKQTEKKILAVEKGTL